MAFNRILFSDTDEQVGQLGGGSWLDDISRWPVTPGTGEPMLPLLTITSNFLRTSFIPEGMALTVFVSVRERAGHFSESHLRKYTVHHQEKLPALAAGYTKVVLHRVATEESFIAGMPNPVTKKYINLRGFTPSEMAEESEDKFSGADFSKQLGRPCWLQDPIDAQSGQWLFLAQIIESDIAKVSPQHEGMFAEGIGYLFADNRIAGASEEGEAGYFFIQFT